MGLILNQKAIVNAKNLIIFGKVNRLNQPWQEIKPSIVQKDKFIKEHNIEEYSLWFLAQDTENKDPYSKAQYKFMFGNFKQIYKSALIKILEQAEELNHEELQQVATELIELIDLSN